MLEVLLRGGVARQIEDRIFSPAETLHAPHLLDLEVLQVLRRYTASGHMGAERGLEAVVDLADLPISRYPHDLLLHRIWELRHNMTAYDAAYVALAESLSAPLLTRDKRLAASSGHVVPVEVV